MKKIVAIMLAMVLVGCFAPLAFSVECDFGDFKSVTITTKAWKALEKGDVEAVLAYTNKCIELYGAEAKKMQASLTEYPKGEADGGKNQDVFNLWALNDVGTCLFIQGEAYIKADMLEEAKEAYNKLINEYSFAQSWDTKGWFWKPAVTAKEKLKMMESGKSYDFGDYSSETLTGKAWTASKQDDLESVLAYTNKCIELHGAEAKKMQASLTEYPKGEADGGKNKDVFNFWALNDVGTCLYIKGEALRKAGKIAEAKEAFNSLINDYFFAQSWDTKGWFWKPAVTAKEKLQMMESGKSYDFGDYSSETLTGKAWTASKQDDLESVLVYTNKCIELYKDKAKAMQVSLTEYPWGETKEKEKENIFKYWALNDVGTCLFIKGEALRKAGKIAEAKEAFNSLINDYFFAQCWDTSGWFWKPVDAAKEKMAEMQ